ncbi:hypothetical protein [Mesorhizobium sp. L103C131B0]|uniref:hypothetical protein n=1 Tax=Mesorhizobium sp. L103C131B0 TaxID=1287089 RepID=UPI0012DD910A|nr:hypothetical protein [Mesorhizobium sp. L103C131B0]
MEIDIAKFIRQLVSTTKPFERFPATEIGETKGVMITVGELTSVLEFLREQGAPQNLSDAVETAMDDVEQWLNPEIQDELFRQVPSNSCTRVPKAFLNLKIRADRLRASARSAREA